MASSRSARRRRAVVRGVAGATAVVLLAGAGALGIATLLSRADGDPFVQRCSAVLDGTSWHLAPDQAETAALIAGTSIQRGMPARAATIGIATGLQESKLRNIDYGDRDSVGIFQQRPSQGWGTVEEIMDPVYSTNTFYDALAKVDRYEEMAITVAAQTVQRSGFPDAYAQHEVRSRAWASALTGHSPAAVTCDLPTAQDGDLDGLLARLSRDLGLDGTAAEDGSVLVDVVPSAEADDTTLRTAWAVAQWAVAVAEPFGVEQVRVEDSTWDRAAGDWTVSDDVLDHGQVLIHVA